MMNHGRPTAGTGRRVTVLLVDDSSSMASVCRMTAWSSSSSGAAAGNFQLGL